MMSGNEAIARGAYEAGVKVATAYPGTPSTEILEALARHSEVHAEWSPNEKVALEVALGAAQAGARSMASMKHVGVNVAADPLLTASYTGARAGLVVVTADDPGMFSSQNEQDNRHYARMAKLPCLEPADPAEARLYAMAAFDLAERFDTPVLLRTTTRISHARAPVEAGPRREPALGSAQEPAHEPGFVKDPKKFVMVPAHARGRHPVVEARQERLAELAEDCPWNRIEWRDRRLGVITGGASYRYVREVCPGASVLKLGLAWPLPRRLVEQFAAGVERLLVVEELDPFWEVELRAAGIPCMGKKYFPITGELGPDGVAAGLARALADWGVPWDEGLGGRGVDGAVGGATAPGTGPASAPGPTAGPTAAPAIPARPPVLCPGCPHRGTFYVLSKLKLTVICDIGCYTLAVQPPLAAVDTCTCMGASITQAMGVELGAGREASRRTVAALGDSTFIHSGITGLIEVVYNGGAVTVVICDNGTTAMTGHQQHPGTGRTAQGAIAPALDLEALCRAVGVRDVRVTDPYDLAATEAGVRAALAHDGPSVVIARRPCILLDRRLVRPALAVTADLCNGCGTCGRLGCPAIEREAEPMAEAKAERWRARINTGLCVGCGICRQVCRRGAITAPTAPPTASGGGD